ncbi:NERD domain-containing protein [Thalassobacillus sp. B23F22_16]|uniref:NERD domain-containing protein n=1 Tax=Thalassobacillus sp. B23F22_16 TaxID=3459513 RepID=UPI00373E4D31
MAQLIKIQDYISRYESNMYRYPGQFIRAKKQHWQTMKQRWSEQRLALEQPVDEPEEQGGISKWRQLFQRKNEEVQDYSPPVIPPVSLQDEKQRFLDEIYTFQLKWATSTLWEKSFMNADYKQDSSLKYFLQRFPDIFFIMYEPIVKIKQAPLEINTLIIGPLGIEIIHRIEAPEGAVIAAEDNKTWVIEGSTKTNFISPLIALNRSETYVKSVLAKYGIDFPYKKVILAPENDFRSPVERYHIDYIGKKEYWGWFEEKRRVRAPLKHQQLKAAEVLVKHSQTSSIKRPEWDQEEDAFFR